MAFNRREKPGMLRALEARNTVMMAIGHYDVKSKYMSKGQQQAAHKHPSLS